MDDATRTIDRAYRLRAYPTHTQCALLGRLFGATRYIWNWALSTRTVAYRECGESINWIALSRQFTALKQRPETAWLCELPREPFNQVLRDQERAFQNFFAKRAAYPKYRRRGQQSAVRFTLDQRRSQVTQSSGRWASVDLPGVGTLKLRQSEALNGRLRSVTLRRDGAGRWYASITADQVAAPVAVTPTTAAIGLDAGLRDLVVAVDAAGQHHRIAAPKALAAKLARLRRYQRSQSRQVAAQLRQQGLDPAKPIPKGTRLGVSKRRAKTQRRIAALYARIGDLRREALHQASTTLVRRAEVICIEDLNVKAMGRSMGRRVFRRSVADASLGELRRQLTYKADWHRRTISVVDRWYPSSKTCSACGAINGSLALREKRWTCACGAVHDRDVNAARNILREGLRVLEGAAPPRSGAYARGEADAAGDGTSSSVTARSTNRELISGQRKRSNPGSTRMERVKAGTG